MFYDTAYCMMQVAHCCIMYCDEDIRLCDLPDSHVRLFLWDFLYGYTTSCTAFGL